VMCQSGFQSDQAGWGRDGRLGEKYIVIVETNCTHFDETVPRGLVPTDSTLSARDRSR